MGFNGMNCNSALQGHIRGYRGLVHMHGVTDLGFIGLKSNWCEFGLADGRDTWRL